MIIDNINQLRLTNSEVKQYTNELRSLDYPAKRLKFLYDHAQNLEAGIKLTSAQNKGFLEI